MANAVFVFSWRVLGEKGKALLQTVTIFAPDAASARSVLDQRLKELRTASHFTEPTLATNPEWKYSVVDLDSPKVVTFAVTS